MSMSGGMSLIDRCGDVEIYQPKQVCEGYSVVETPAEEFMLEIIRVKKGEKFTIPVISVPRILIGFEGKGTTSNQLLLK